MTASCFGRTPLRGDRTGAVYRDLERHPAWTEVDEVWNLMAPARVAQDEREGTPPDDVVVVGLDHQVEYGPVVLRSEKSGEKLGEMAVPWIAHVAATWWTGKLLIAVASERPDSLMCLVWAGERLTPTLDIQGIRAQSVAMSASEDGAALAYVSNAVCHVIDPIAGVPLGEATGHPDHHVQVDAPYGTRFLLGDEVHALPPCGRPLPWPEAPMSAGQLPRGDRQRFGSHQSQERQPDAADKSRSL